MLYVQGNNHYLVHSFNNIIYCYTSIMQTTLFCIAVNVIVVLDQERVYNDLKKQFGSKVQIVHLPKSGGVRRRFSYSFLISTLT